MQNYSLHIRLKKYFCHRLESIKCVQLTEQSIYKNTKSTRRKCNNFRTLIKSYITHTHTHIYITIVNKGSLDGHCLTLDSSVDSPATVVFQILFPRDHTGYNSIIMIVYNMRGNNRGKKNSSLKTRKTRILLFSITRERE